MSLAFHHPMHASRGHFLLYEWSVRASRPNSNPMQTAHAFCTQTVSSADHDYLWGIAQSIVSTAQPELVVLESDLLVPMLLWSTRQSWANVINWEIVRKNWTPTLAVPGAGTSTHIENACSAIELTRELFEEFSTERVQRYLLDFWLDSTREGVWLLRTVQQEAASKDDKNTLYSGWLDLLILASGQSLMESSASVSAFARTSNRDLHWNARVIDQMRSSSQDDQRRYMHTVLESALPAMTKVSICQFVNAENWLDPAMKSELLLWLPDKQEDRLPWLHWFGFNRSQGDAHIAAMNQRLVTEYCPDVASAVNALARTEDWTSVTNMVTLSQAIAQAAKNTASLALPIDCFDGDTVAC